VGHMKLLMNVAIVLFAGVVVGIYEEDLATHLCTASGPTHRSRKI
jgi:hypothetical protein